MAGTVTEFQEIPPGRLASYLTLSKVLETSPRAVGGALRCNPYAPRVPCHRVIAANGYIGGFKGDWEKAPSGFNQTMKHKVWFDGPWDMNGKNVRKAYTQAMEDSGPEAVSEMKARRQRKK